MLVCPQIAAKRLGVKADTLKRWRQEGKGPAYVKMGTLVRYDERDLEAFVQVNRVVPAT